MEKSVLLFKENVDAWIKQIRNELSEFEDIPAVVEENVNNIQHNYELIQEMRDEVEDLKQELKLLKIMHILVLKQKNEQVNAS
ncbi:hypothetical protein HY491_04930 [Candidatus Woesearchaeota archaeon]|nr:hypothetical protein [Candidatus Woesearchaeota archaeon]